MKPECERAIQSKAGRKLTKEELDGIEERISSSLRELATKDRARFLSMSPSERMTEAAGMAKERMMADLARAHEAAITEAGRKARLQADLDAVKPGLLGQMQALKLRVTGIEYKRDGIAANFFRLLDPGTIDGGKMLGLIHDPGKTRDIMAALYGEPSTPEAKAAAGSIKGMLDAVAARFQRSGLALNAREDYRMPQPMEPALVARAGREAWVEDALSRVDRAVYVNPDGTAMSSDRLREFLGESYRSIATDGANRRATSEPANFSPLVGGSRNAPRRLFWKDSESWLYMMERYGRTTNLYDLVGSHVRGMAKDIALAEEFGRNADQNVSQALARAYENDLTAAGPSNVAKVTALQEKVQRLFDALAHPGRPGNETWANLGIQLRGLMASSQLGSLFGALPDLAGLKLAAEHNGLPSMRLFRDALDAMTSGEEKQAFLHKMGIWQEGFQHASNRMAADEFRSGWGTWLNETTHRLMGLNAFDRGMRAGMGRVVMDTLGNFTRRFATLAEAEGEARLLQDHGITQDHWNTWRAAEVDAGRGNETLLTPDAIYRIPDAKLGTPERALQLKDEAAEKLLEVAYREMQFGARGASNSTIEDRLAMGLDPKNAGTVAGELWRFAMQFKSVPIGIFRAHLERAMGLDTWGSRMAYGARFVGYSTLLGALAVEIKAAINGQDPRSMNINTEDGKKFWMEAIAAGGGFGLYGDLFAHGETQQGSGAETLAGPGISAGWNVLQEIRQAEKEVMEGDTTHPFALSSVRWIRKNATPLANLWYLKAAFNRLVFDELQETLAPGSADRQRARMEARGASYWWAPGTTSPQNAPDLGKAFE